LCYDPEAEAVEGEATMAKVADQGVQVQSGNECIYYASGTQLGKIEVPSMTPLFTVNTGHAGPITDMTVSQLNQIVTTSQDGSIRFFNQFDGQPLAEPLEEMECDHLAAAGVRLLTRVGDGAAMLVWRAQASGGVEDTPVGEVELDEADKDRGVEQFRMKAGVQVNPDNADQDREELVMMYDHGTHVHFKILAQALNKL